MSWTEKMIRSEGDIYCFFGMIQKVVPQRVCDYSLFLCRFASVTRGLGSYTISKNIHLAGLDLYPESTPQIYHKIYDRIYTRNDVKGQLFDLGILLRLAECAPEADDSLIENACDSCKWLVTDDESYHFFHAFSDADLMGTITMEGQKYHIIKGRGE